LLRVVCRCRGAIHHELRLPRPRQAAAKRATVASKQAKNERSNERATTTTTALDRFSTSNILPVFANWTETKEESESCCWAWPS